MNTPISLIMLLVFVYSGDRFEFHTEPDKWERPREFHTPYDNNLR